MFLISSAQLPRRTLTTGMWTPLCRL